MTAAERALGELEEKGTAAARFKDSFGAETTIEVRRLSPNETIYGHGTHVPCYQCGRRIFPEGPVEIEIRNGERWVKPECKSPNCAAYQQPHWYNEVAGNPRE